MFEDLIKIIPMSLGAAISPGILAVTLVILGGKRFSKRHTIALLFGLLVTGVITIFVGFNFGQALPEGMGENLTTSIINLILGIIFVILAIKILISKERKIKLKKEIKHENIKLAILGFILSATNFDALFLSFAAAKEVGGSADLNDLEKSILLIFILFCVALPITLPLFIYIIVPNAAARVLGKMNRFVIKYSKYIMFGLFMIFGVILLYQGIIYFLK